MSVSRLSRFGGLQHRGVWDYRNHFKSANIITKDYIYIYILIIYIYMWYTHV